MLGDNLLLISLNAQSIPGFVNEVQADTREMRRLTGRGPADFERIPIKLCNLKGSGLRAMCIREFSTDDDIATFRIVAPTTLFASVERSGSS